MNWEQDTQYTTETIKSAAPNEGGGWTLIRDEGERANESGTVLNPAVLTVRA